MAQGAPTSEQEMRAATDEPEQTPDHHATTEVTWFDFLPVLQLHARSEWRRERVWNPTFSICNVLILLLSLSAEIRTPSASPSNLSKSVFSYPWLTGEPLLIHPLIPQSARAAKSVGVAQPPALAPRSRFTNIQLGPLVGGRSVSQMPTARPTSSSWKTRA